MAAGSLLSPRSRARAYADVGERPAVMAGQRVRRGRWLRRLRRRVHPSRVGLAVAVLTFLLGAGASTTYWLLTSTRFLVGPIDVHGASRLTPARVVELSGIAPGTNLFRLDTHGVVLRLQQAPEVRRAEVARVLPNRVVITVDERRPFTLVHAGRLHWIDEEGMTLGIEPRAVVPVAPVISGLSPDEVVTMRSTPSPKAQVAIGLIRTLMRTGSPLLSEISEIDMSRAEGPVLYTVDGVEVRLGQDGLEGRLSRLEGVLGQIAAGDEPVSSIDLRFRDQVVLKGGR